MIFYMGDVDFDLLQKVTVSFCKSNRTWKVINLPLGKSGQKLENVTQSEIVDPSAQCGC